jgi:hypothetical protein
VSGAEEAGKASERWKNRLSEIADMFKAINKMQERRLNHAQEMRGIGGITSSESAKEQVTVSQGPIERAADRGQ